MKKVNRFNSIGLQSGIYSLVSFSIVILLFIILIIRFITAEFLSFVIKDNIDYSQSFIHLIDSNLDSYSRELYLEANKSIILNSVLSYQDSQYFIEDYLGEITIGGLEWNFAILDYNKELVVKTDGFKFKNLLWINDNENSQILEEDHVIISAPVRYNNLPEGYLLGAINFNTVFDKTLDLIRINNDKQFKAYSNGKLLSSTDNITNNNIAYSDKLTSLDILVEVLTPQNQIDYSISSLRRKFILLALIFSLLSVFLLSFIVSKSLGTPLKKLKEDIENATLSDDWKITFNKNTAKEIIFVGKAFDKVHKSLINRRRELEEKNKTLEIVNYSLNKTQEKLIQSEKMASIGQLAAGVAHEINNPTGFVHTNLQTLHEYIGSLKALFDLDISIINKELSLEEYKKKFKKINDEDDLDYIFSDIKPLIDESLDGTKRIKDIVQGLRDFARKDNDEFKMGNVNNSIEDAIRLTWNEIKYKCTVHKKLSPLPDTICNQDQLTQVIVNLLINSSHAIDSMGDIYIYSNIKNNRIYIRVSDTGSGISKDNLKKLFDPFFSTKEVGKGTGLGLSIVHGIIEKHSGTITVKSIEGKATCFIIELPITREHK